MIQSELLLVVDTIAKRGSFAAAAQELHKVPSAISYAVKRLEQQMGFAIFERRERKVFLTPAGEYLLIEGRKILHQLSELESDAKWVHAGHEKRCRITFNHCINMRQLSHFIAAFYKANPHTELDIAYEVFFGTWDALFHKRTDFVVGAPDGMPVGGNFSSKLLGHLNWVMAISPKLPLAKLKQPLTNDQLRKYRALCVHDTSRVFEGRHTWYLNNQEILYCPNMTFAVEAAITGLGIAFLPHFLVKDEINKNNLVIRKVAEPKEPSAHYFAWPRNDTGKAIQWCVNYFSTAKQATAWL